MLPDTLGNGVREDDGGDSGTADAIKAIQKGTGSCAAQLLVFSGGADSKAKVSQSSTTTVQAVVADSAGAVSAVAVQAAVVEEVETRLDQIREAKAKGYEGDACGECGNFTLVRNGTCMKCVTCGATSGCS